MSAWRVAMGKRKSRAAVELGRKRWAKMTPEERAEFVRQGGVARQQQRRLKKNRSLTEESP